MFTGVLSFFLSTLFYESRKLDFFYSVNIKYGVAGWNFCNFMLKIKDLLFYHFVVDVQLLEFEKLKYVEYLKV